MEEIKVDDNGKRYDDRCGLHNKCINDKVKCKDCLINMNGDVGIYGIFINYKSREGVSE